MTGLVRSAFGAPAMLAVMACISEPAPASEDVSGTTATETNEVASPTALTAVRETDFSLDGDVQQGGVIRGVVPGGTEALTFNGNPVELAPDGAFIVAFGRDYSGPATLTATLADGRALHRRLSVAPTNWRISHVNASPRGGVSSAAFRRRRAPELAQIVAAREVRSDVDGWRQEFQWPVTGRISGAFGRQRIYRGTPGSYHSGVDIARPTGTPIVAPADGVVVLVSDSPFTLEGNLLMIDHGMGLNSAFLHLSRIDVREGERVERGQRVGAVGATGRATGPHLHWSMKWQDERIDPQLLAGPMP